jgi:hypothetical protein
MLFRPDTQELALLRALAVSPTELEEKLGFEHLEKTFRNMIRKERSRSKKVT